MRAPRLLEAGALVGGRYRVECFLAEGGMAKVYQAMHTGTHRQVALKLVHPQLVERKQIVEKFLDEARLAGRIPPHPNIVQVFDSGRDEETGAPFIAMELIEGKLLNKHIQEEALPWSEARQLLEQLADALDEAHGHQIVHRDLKPNNLIVTQARDGSLLLKVLDFGIAKVLGDGAAATATAIGTPVFCAPEQLGATMRKVAQLRGFTIDVGVSPATDVWAFALLAYQMLTGHPPEQYWQENEMSALMAKIALEDRMPASEAAGERALHLPHGFDGWFLRCLRHSAAERYPSIGEAMKALSALLVNDSSLAAPQAAELGSSGVQGSTLRMAPPRVSQSSHQDIRVDVSGPHPSVQMQALEAPKTEGPYTWRPVPGGHTTTDIPTPATWPGAGPTPYAAWLSGRSPLGNPRQAAFTAGALAAITMMAIVLVATLNRGSAEPLRVVPILSKPPGTPAAPAASEAIVSSSSSVPTPERVVSQPEPSATAAASAPTKVSASARTQAAPAPSPGRLGPAKDDVWGWN